jgi:D-alanyl-lipoteichoic acid acyltransferase DltB (MBOAT superfamily)
MLLLFGSYVFYMSWEPSYAALLGLITVVNYYLAIRLGRSITVRGKKTILALTVTINAGLLFSLKYLGFFAESLRTVFHHHGVAAAIPVFSIALPVGISFYTFKIMSYTIDVYRGKLEPERNIGLFALYVAFFPQLIAGPIDRSTRLLPQFREEQMFDYRRVSDGLKLILWGFFQKMVIAGTLTIMVDLVYSKPGQYDAPTLALATLFFAFQIYCDFSGYSDIAIGIAQVFGYGSINNFERPYFSRSIPEFWRRWHISLSTWFRDYLYIPLGGSRISIPRWHVNIMIVFLVSGLWHGANWTFVVWGAIHGCYYILSVLTKSAREKTVATLGLVRLPRLHQGIQMAITFCLVTFTWIFFRANTISDAFYIVSKLFTGWGSASETAGTNTLASFVSSHFFEFCVAIVSITVMGMVHTLQVRGNVRNMLRSKPIWLRWAAYYAIVAAILLLSNFGSKQFIYFQF